MNEKGKNDSSYRGLWKYHITGLLTGVVLGALIGYLVKGSSSAVPALAIAIGFVGELVGLLVWRNSTRSEA